MLVGLSPKTAPVLKHESVAISLHLADLSRLFCRQTLPGLAACLQHDLRENVDFGSFRVMKSEVVEELKR